jgi:hypothetical protein
MELKSIEASRGYAHVRKPRMTLAHQSIEALSEYLNVSWRKNQSGSASA